MASSVPPPLLRRNAVRSASPATSTGPVLARAALSTPMEDVRESKSSAPSSSSNPNPGSSAASQLLRLSSSAVPQASPPPPSSSAAPLASHLAPVAAGASGAAIDRSLARPVGARLHAMQGGHMIPLHPEGPMGSVTMINSDHLQRLASKGVEWAVKALARYMQDRYNDRGNHTGNSTDGHSMIRESKRRREASGGYKHSRDGPVARDGPGAGIHGSEVILPNISRDHLDLHTRQYLRFDRTYESDWTYYNPFSIAAFYQFDADTPYNPVGPVYAVEGAAYDASALSFSWIWGDGDTGQCPLMNFGMPYTSDAATPALTPKAYDVSAAPSGWGQALVDMLNLAHMLQYWCVPVVEMIIERLPENPQFGDAFVNNEGIPQPGNDDKGLFYLAPWGGEPGWFAYATDAGAGTTAGAPNKYNLTGDVAANIWSAVETDAFKYRKVYQRFNKSDRHPDHISLAVSPTNPTFVASQLPDTPGTPATVLQGFQESAYIDIYDWANNTKVIKGFCFKLMWANNNPLSSASVADPKTAAYYASMKYRIKFRMRVVAKGAHSWDDAAAIPAAMVAARAKDQHTAMAAIAPEVVKARQDKDLRSANLLAQAARQLAGAAPSPDEDDDWEDSLCTDVKRQKFTASTQPQTSQQQQVPAQPTFPPQLMR